MARLTPMARQILTQTMRQAIVNAGKEIIATEGVENLTATRLAARLGVARGTLYNYFKNRVDFLLVILEEGFTNIISLLEELDGKDCPAQEKLERLAIFLLEGCEQQQKLYQAVKRYCLPDMEADFRRRHHEVTTRMQKIFVAGIEEGGLRPMDPMVAAAFFYGALWELSCQRNQGNFACDCEQVRSEVFTMLRLTFQKQ